MYIVQGSDSDLEFTFANIVAYERAQDWYNNPINSKDKMVKFCAENGVNLMVSADYLHDDWSDMAMECYARVRGFK